MEGGGPQPEFGIRKGGKGAGERSRSFATRSQSSETRVIQAAVKRVPLGQLTDIT